MKEKNVKMGEEEVTDGSEILSAKGVGSCVVVYLIEKEGSQAGIAHVALPSKESSKSEKYTNNLLDKLLEDLREEGVSEEDLEAKIIGGAELFDFSSHIGKKNIESVDSYLEEKNIPVVARDVGGEEGRSAAYHPDSKQVEVKKPFGDKKLL